MPGTMFMTADELASLPTSGTAYNRALAVANASAGTPDMMNKDSIVQAKVFVQALVYARTGAGVGRAAIESKILAMIGTETGTSQPLNSYRQIAAWICAADLIDLNNATFDAWVVKMADYPLKGNNSDNWGNVRQTSRVSGNNWGAYARSSMAAIAGWLKKRNKTSSAGQTGQAMYTELVPYFKRWLGDTSQPDTFGASSSFSSGWTNVNYPHGGGVINSGVPSTPGQLPGANSEDASRGSSGPPAVGIGVSYQMEALDGALMTAILLHHAGYTDVWSWSNSALRRNGQHLGSSNFASANHIYESEPRVLNKVYGLGLSNVSAQDSYGGRAVPFCTDWLAGSPSLWPLGTDGGGGGTEIAPSPAFSLARTNQTVTLTDTSTAGSVPITRREINWGDGSAVQTLNAPTATATHTYNPSVATTYTVRDTVYGDTTNATITHTVLVPSPDGAPVIVLAVTPMRGVGPLTVSYDFAGSFDPNGDAMTYRIDFGDGTVLTSAPTSGTHIYAGGTSLATYTLTGRITAGALTSSTITKTITVDPIPTATTAVWRLFISVGGKLQPLNKDETYKLAAGEPIPADAVPGRDIIFRTS